MQTDAELNEVFIKTTEKIKEPVTQDELEFLLVYDGLAVDLKKQEIAVRMEKLGFKRKQMMRDRVRKWYWTKNNMKQNNVSLKIRFVSFLNRFLEGKTQVDQFELKEAMKQEGFTLENCKNHFFYTEYPHEGEYKKWKGWVFVGSPKDKYYKKVDLDDEKSE